MRTIFNINQHWSFAKDSAQIPAAIAAEAEFVDLPHSWNAVDGMDGGADYFRGTCCYAKEITKAELPQADHYFLEINGANSSADVYVGGKHLAHHDGGYSTWRVDITEALGDSAILAITVDNAPNNTVYPQVADFTFYGGIYRNVNIIAVSESHFDLETFGTPGIHVTPVIEGDDAKVSVKTFLVNQKPEQVVRYCLMNAEGKVLGTYEGGSAANFRIKNVHRWHGRKDPYLYTMNYRNYAELTPMIQPMYYSHPKSNGAYEVPNQYWFGSELMAAPITEKRDPHSGMAGTEVWLPRGNWFDFFTGLRYASRRGRKLKVSRGLESAPLFAKAGAIVPLANYEKHDNRLRNAEKLRLFVFPGGDNRFTLYEDGGEGYDFQKGGFARTEIILEYGAKAVLTIRPAEGDLSLIPENRSWEIGLRGWHRSIRVAAEAQALCRYDAATNTTYVTVEAPVTRGIRLEITGEALLHDNSDVEGRIGELLQFAQMFNEWKNYIMDVVRSNVSLHQKIYRITGRMQEVEGIVEAVEELLTLTEDEYLGSQEL